jgi:hypothetical protein
MPFSNLDIWRFFHSSEGWLSMLWLEQILSMVDQFSFILLLGTENGSQA